MAEKKAQTTGQSDTTTPFISILGNRVAEKKKQAKKKRREVAAASALAAAAAAVSAVAASLPAPEDSSNDIDQPHTTQ